MGAKRMTNPFAPASRLAHEAAALLAEQLSWTPALQDALACILTPSPSPPLLCQVLKHPFTPPHLACRLFEWASLSHPLDSSLSRALADSLSRPSHLSALLPALRYLHDARIPLLPPFFTTLISSLGRAGMPLHAKHLFFSMPLLSCAPTLSACNSLLQALLTPPLLPASSAIPLERLCQALALFEHMPSMGFQPDRYTYTILMCGFLKAGEIEQALQIFTVMLDNGCEPDTLIYNLLIDWLSKHEQVDKALQVLEQMLAMGCSPNTFTYTSVIEALLHAERVNTALSIMAERNGEGGCNLALNVFMNWFVKRGRIEEALELLGYMTSFGGCGAALTVAF